MSTPSRVLALVLAATASPALAAGPDLGAPVPAEEMALWDRSPMPDGRGLPPGHGSVAQGARLYAERCATCHGDRGQGHEKVAGLALVGGIGSLAGDRPVKTVGSFWPHATTLFDYVRRAMPQDRPGSLADEEVYALSAYVLHLNGIVGADAVLDARSLPAVRMPNADGFVPWWPPPGR